MKPITKPTRAQAWLAAARALADLDERIYNLILEIEQPGTTTPRDAKIEQRLDTFLRAHDLHPLNTVAETIFPATEYKLRGLAGVYAYADTIYPLIRSESPWGTYALRLTRRAVHGDGKPINPLELLIEKGKRQLKTRGPKYATYELGLGLEALEVPLYAAESDHNNVIGGQCLSHISVKLGPRPHYAIHLTALYRYQYFAQKALGNLLGLARLQACIARELGVPIGPLVCHATLGVLEDRRIDNGAPWSHADVKALITECESISESEEDLVA